MKFLPVLRPLVLVATALTLNACETAANRRELYNTSEANGPWHDYARRREAEAEVGLPPGSTSTVPTSTTSAPRLGPTTPLPRKGPPLQADPTALPSANTPAPSATTTTTVSPAAAPNPTTATESAPAPSTSEPAAPRRSPRAVRSSRAASSEDRIASPGRSYV